MLKYIDILWLNIVFVVFMSCKTESIEPVIASEGPSIQQYEFYDASYLMGKFDPATHEDFITISLEHADRPGLFLHKEAYEAFKEMYQAALAQDIKLVIRSATRNFDYQKGIWERKWTGETILSDSTNAAIDIDDPVDRAIKILEYSSMPGTSRHHWGTDIDLNSFNNKRFEYGDGLKVYNWLQANASRFGYCQPYTEKNEMRPEGYNEEKWHWTYTPISKMLTKMAEKKLDNFMIDGFEGSAQAPSIDVVKKYVLGINNNCK